jgi:hypothetical protein
MEDLGKQRFKNECTVGTATAVLVLPGIHAIKRQILNCQKSVRIVALCAAYGTENFFSLFCNAIKMNSFLNNSLQWLLQYELVVDQDGG